MVVSRSQAEGAGRPELTGASGPNPPACSHSPLVVSAALRERWWFGVLDRARIGGREGQQGEQGQSRRGRPEAQTTNTIGVVRVYGIGLLAIHADSFSQRMIRSPLITSAGSTPAILGKYFTKGLTTLEYVRGLRD